MYNHEPKLYVCPFCRLSKGKTIGINDKRDIVFEDKNTIAFVSPKWWIHNAGHIIVVPKKHHENIYDIPDNILSDVYKTAKKIAIAIRETYSCDGTSMRQHNEPAGNQDVWHFHVHVFPRYKNDNLYLNHKNTKIILSHKDKKQFVDRIKKYMAE